MSISVAALTFEDRPQWEALYQGYADFYQVPMTPEILETVWQWIFGENNAFYCLVATDETNNLVGLMHYRAMPSPLRGKSVGFLDDLFVLPSSRGSGAVDKLFDELEASAKQQGWPLVRWITAENNYRGRAVYDKLSTKTPWQTYQMDIKLAD